jgi:hypothetical protein
MKENICEMVDIVEEWLYNATESEKSEFVNCKKEELISYHTSLGRNIRNHFKLWEYPHTPVIVNGIDIAEDHPDQISMKIIETVWERNKNE